MANEKSLYLHSPATVSMPTGGFCRPQLVALTFGYRRRNQRKVRRLRRQGNRKV